jgi:hypothetical protein
MAPIAEGLLWAALAACILESAPRTRSFVPARRRASSPNRRTAAGASLIGTEIRVVLDADSSELWDYEDGCDSAFCPGPRDR